MYCLDWDSLKDDLDIWGSNADEANYQRVEFMMLPCNYRHTEVEDIGHVVSDECIDNISLQQDYLKSLRVVILTSENEFKVNEYGEESMRNA